MEWRRRKNLIVFNRAIFTGSPHSQLELPNVEEEEEEPYLRKMYACTLSCC